MRCNGRVEGQIIQHLTVVSKLIACYLVLITLSVLCRVLTVGGLEIMPVCKLLQDLLTTLTAVCMPDIEIVVYIQCVPKMRLA